MWLQCKGWQRCQREFPSSKSEQSGPPISNERQKKRKEQNPVGGNTRCKEERRQVDSSKDSSGLKLRREAGFGMAASENQLFKGAGVTRVDAD